MTQDDYARKLDELDRLLNDPDVPMQPSRIWSLLAELSQRDLKGALMSPQVTSSVSPHGPAE